MGGIQNISTNIIPVKYRWFLLSDIVRGHVACLHAAVLDPPPVLAVVDEDESLVPPHVKLLVTLGRVVILGKHKLGVLAGSHFVHDLSLTLFLSVTFQNI